MSKNKKKINIIYKELNSGIVTGSMHFLEVKVFGKTTNILLDMGAIQDNGNTKELFNRNRIDMDMSHIDHVLVSHGHLDHTMNLCQLSRLDFDGTIYTTDMTLKLMEHITLDGINIHNKNVEYLNKISKKGHVYPYMDLRSRENMLSRVRAYGYEQWIQLEDGIRVKFIPNGHISGSASIVIEVQDGYEKESILYMSDTSVKRNIPFTKELDLRGYKFNTAIIESTYGSVYIPERPEEQIIEDLYRIIKSTCLEKNGDVMIPSFALSRSTNIALYLKKVYEKYPELNEIPIYMASPLMVKCHKTISTGFEFYDDKWKDNEDLFSWDRINYISEYDDLMRVSRKQEACIWISSSGMADKGYNSFLTSHIVKRRNNTMVFVGYCADGTVGRKILDGKQKTLTSNIDGEKVTVYIRANIENLTGLSSHACGCEILDELSKSEKKKLRNIIIVHGDKDRANGLSEIAKRKFPNANIFIPKSNKWVKLN